MFTPADRDALLGRLVTAARADGAVGAAALVGSIARGEADDWSDIDLALELLPGVTPLAAADAWTARMRSTARVADTLDVHAGEALYRVFLLRDSLQVDLSFWPAGTLRPVGGPLLPLFGALPAEEATGAPASDDAIGRAWLYALHARSAIARGRGWQALQMIDELRARLVELACLRHGLPPHQGRGVDRLPDEELAGLLPTVPRGVRGPDLARSLVVALDRLSAEVRWRDAPLADRLAPALAALRSSAVPPGAVGGVPE